MADPIVITAANIIPVAGFVPYDGTSGVTVTAGQWCYLDSTTSTFKLADADLSSAAAAVVGMALHAALASQPLRLIQAGSVGMGAILTAGLFYYLSKTAGGMCVIADATSCRISMLGYATTTSNLSLRITNTDVSV